MLKPEYPSSREEAWKKFSALNHNVKRVKPILTNRDQRPMGDEE